MSEPSSDSPRPWSRGSYVHGAQNLAPIWTNTEGVVLGLSRGDATEHLLSWGPLGSGDSSLEGCGLGIHLSSGRNLANDVWGLCGINSETDGFARCSSV